MVENKDGLNESTVAYKQPLAKEMRSGFSVNDCPIWVYRGIKEPAMERFNDTYWMRIAELLWFEEAYYNLVGCIGQVKVYNDGSKPTESVKETETTTKKEEDNKPKYLGSGRN
jgi:hypothetical protein